MKKSQRQGNSIEDVIARRRTRLKQRDEALLLLRRIILLGAAGWFLFTQAFMFAGTQGMEMFPSLKDGDLAVIFRLQQGYAAKDVIVYEAEGTLHTGRIIACANDVVSMDDSGILQVNGTVQGGDIQYRTYARKEGGDSVRVPEGCVYVLGDYRPQSRDSRDFGAVPLENVKGKVITVLRRRGI